MPSTVTLSAVMYRPQLMTAGREIKINEIGTFTDNGQFLVDVIVEDSA